MHAMGIRSIALDMGCRIAELNRSQHKEIKLKSAWAGFNEDGTRLWHCRHLVSSPKRSQPRMKRKDRQTMWGICMNKKQVSQSFTENSQDAADDVV